MARTGKAAAYPRKKIGAIREKQRADGISGTRLDKPCFMAMMEEAEAGNVDCIVIKDMSCLGRDYLKGGQIISKGVFAPVRALPGSVNNFFENWLYVSGDGALTR